MIIQQIRPLFFATFLVIGGLQASHAQNNASADKWSGNGLKIELAPLGLDQARAFFIGRDFSAADAEFIVQSGCIFRSAIGNAGEDKDDPAIRIELGKWRVLRGDVITGVKTREEWAKILEDRNIPESPRIAFNWGLFPTSQEHLPTDYNWGLISFDLPPGTQFDLELNWTRDGEEQVHLLKKLECAK